MENKKVFKKYVLIAIAILMITASLILISNVFKKSKIPQKALENPEYGLPIKD